MCSSLSQLHNFIKNKNIHMTCECIDNDYSKYKCTVFYNNRSAILEIIADEIPTLSYVLNVIVTDVEIAHICKDEVTYGKILESSRDDITLSNQNLETVRQVAWTFYWLFGPRVMAELSQAITSS